MADDLRQRYAEALMKLYEPIVYPDAKLRGLDAAVDECLAVHRQWRDEELYEPQLIEAVARAIHEHNPVQCIPWERMDGEYRETRLGQARAAVRVMEEHQRGGPCDKSAK